MPCRKSGKKRIGTAKSRPHLFLRQHYLHQVTRVYSQPALLLAHSKEKIQHPQDEKLTIQYLNSDYYTNKGLSPHLKRRRTTPNNPQSATQKIGRTKPLSGTMTVKEKERAERTGQPYADSRFIEVNGFNVHYRLAGSGKPLVVLLHGSFLSLRSWRFVFERLA